MDINLGYIEGISNIDTPYFSNISAQNDFFTNHQVTSISTTFYPPHYRNSIRFDVEDIDFTNQINYLWFEYNSKVYYYFIDDIEYINENVIELSIIMDVIQTYFFNIDVHNGIIERKFINRFHEHLNSINRSYLRENVSNKLFVEKDKNFVSYPYYYNADRWIVLKCSSLNDDKSYNTSINDGYNKGISSFAYLILPYGKIDSYEVIDATYDPDKKTGKVMNWAISELLKSLSPYIIDSYVISYFPYSDKVRIDGNKLYILDKSIFTMFPYTQPTSVTTDPPNPDIENYYWIFPVYFPDYKVIEMDDKPPWSLFSNSKEAEVNVRRIKISSDLISYDFPLQRNTAKGNYFQSYYMTQLLDENYIHIEFGDDSAITSYPLFRYKDLDLGLKAEYWVNLDSGIVNFHIYETNNESINYLNEYDSLVQDTNIPFYDIKVDALTEYAANNRNRWMVAGINTAQNAMSSFIDIVTTYGLASSRINSIRSDSSNYDRRYKEPHLNKKSTAKIESISNSTLERTGGIASEIMGIADPIMKVAFTEQNLKYAPDNVKQISNVGSKLSSNNIRPFTRITFVNNFEECAYYFHLNGFLVNQPYPNGNTSIFDYVRNRYYFNVIKMRELDVHLFDYINDEDTLRIIKDRFLDGMRLWNVEYDDVSIGDFTYDNVELAYLE